LFSELRVLGTEQAKRRFILFDRGKPQLGKMEMIVGGIIVDGRDLTDESVAIDGMKGVIDARWEGNRFACPQHDRVPGLYLVLDAIASDGHGDVGNTAIFC
jgi:hypothetical protein